MEIRNIAIIAHPKANLANPTKEGWQFATGQASTNIKTNIWK